LQSEHTIFTWLLRGMSFLLIWISIILIFNPINAILAILPPLMHLTGFLTAIIAFVIALVLWLIATTISIILHNVWLAIGTAIIVLIILLWVTRWRWRNTLNS
jgi:hypothetical protein